MLCVRREELKEKLREKLELEKRALKVVERLLDDSVAEDFLVDCVCVTGDFRQGTSFRQTRRRSLYSLLSRTGPVTLTSLPSLCHTKPVSFIHTPCLPRLIRISQSQNMAQSAVSRVYNCHDIPMIEVLLLAQYNAAWL